MNVIEKIKLELEKYKDGMVSVDDAAKEIRDIAFMAVVPSFDLLQARLENGCEIKQQDSRWYLYDRDDEYVASGYTIRGLLVNLIFTDC